MPQFEVQCAHQQGRVWLYASSVHPLLHVDMLEVRRSSKGLATLQGEPGPLGRRGNHLTVGSDARLSQGPGCLVGKPETVLSLPDGEVRPHQREDNYGQPARVRSLQLHLLLHV